MEPKYSFGCSISKPNGCLLNPEGSRMIFFEECKNPPKPNLKIHTHLFYTNHLGEPGGYKSSEKLNIDSAWEKWHELHQKGWTEVYYHYGWGLPFKKRLKKSTIYVYMCQYCYSFVSYILKIIYFQSITLHLLIVVLH